MEKNRPDWRRDYQATTGGTFFGPAPAFEQIMRVVGDFERDFNHTETP